MRQVDGRDTKVITDVDGYIERQGDIILFYPKNITGIRRVYHMSSVNLLEENVD